MLKFNNKNEGNNKPLDNKGFTLIEVLAAGLIIIILLTIVVEGVTSAGDWFARSEEKKREARAITRAIEGNMGNTKVAIEDINEPKLYLGDLNADGGFQVEYNLSNGLEGSKYSYIDGDLVISKYNIEFDQSSLLSDELYQRTIDICMEKSYIANDGLALFKELLEAYKTSNDQNAKRKLLEIFGYDTLTAYQKPTSSCENMQEYMENYYNYIGYDYQENFLVNSEFNTKYSIYNKITSKEYVGDLHIMLFYCNFDYVIIMTTGDYASPEGSQRPVLIFEPAEKRWYRCPYSQWGNLENFYMYVPTWKNITSCIQDEFGYYRLISWDATNPIEIYDRTVGYDDNIFSSRVYNYIKNPDYAWQKLIPLN